MSVNKDQQTYIYIFSFSPWMMYWYVNTWDCFSHKSLCLLSSWCYYSCLPFLLSICLWSMEWCFSPTTVASACERMRKTLGNLVCSAHSFPFSCGTHLPFEKPKIWNLSVPKSSFLLQIFKVFLFPFDNIQVFLFKPLSFFKQFLF